MLKYSFVGSTLACALASSAFAGPCTQRIADLEKAATARHEGAGPTLSGSATTTGSAGQPSSGTSVKAEATTENQAMQLLQQAKELDRQRKETECMQIVTRVESLVPAGTK